jgi:hypothetical protein
VHSDRTTAEEPFCAKCPNSRPQAHPPQAGRSKPALGGGDSPDTFSRYLMVQLDAYLLLD